MKTARLVFLLLTIFLILSPKGAAAGMKSGSIYEGFRLLEKKFVKEVNAECLYFIHEKTGARLFKINSKDDNKTFAIAFRTDPESNSGTPHIMEHSVLNGSKSFPVKSPYDVLRKGSLLTFINAFTGKDLTCFPIASKNDKDYFNLMHVYLDAVFQPNLRTDPRILKQEGWHYEMEDVNGPVIYKGVVYNEMKGAFSNPTQELFYQVCKNLFPDNGYRFSSGGYPADIPKLTHKAFVEYHDKYYHPSNSYILLYGDAEVEKELAFINKEYLSKYDKKTQPDVFAIQKPFTATKRLILPYSVTEGTDTLNQTYLSFSCVVGLNTDRALVMGLNTICDVLVNQEAAPLRLALQKAGIGKEVSAWVNDMRQNVFEIIVQNANTADKERFLNIVLETLKEAADKGIDKKAVEGSINRAEFNLREGNNAQKGLSYAFQILPGWFFASDPFLTLEYEKPLAKLKTALTGNYLESIIKEQILSNPHSLLLALEPLPGFDRKFNAQVKHELENYKAGLNDQEKEKLVAETKELIAYQKRQDTPEALATVPLLERKDINPKADWYELNESKFSDVPVFRYESFTNNVVYARMLFDMRVLPQELLPYAALLTEVLGNQNTKNYSYGELDNHLNISTGGFNSFLSIFAENRNDENIMPKFVVNSKAMNNKTGKMLNLMEEIIKNTKFGDEERLKAILLRYQSRLDAQVKEEGLNFAQTRTMSYYSNSGMFNEITSGISYYWRITDLARNFDQKAEEIKSNLIRTASLLFNRNNMTILITGGKEDLKGFDSHLKGFINALPARDNIACKWNFSFEKKNEGFQAPSKVQYVIKGYNYKKLGYEWDGKLRVLNQIISRDWLQNRIRVIGGAYGGFCSIDDWGNIMFSSYRDPNLKETLENYNATTDYLDKLELDEKALTRFILGTISGMDVPLTPVQKAYSGLTYHFNNVKKEDVQKVRDAVLSTTLSDIKSFSKMIKAVMEQNAYCVYGNDEKITSQKELFGNVQNILK